ncbi:MAG: T9SS type A sorting domain-containing protein [Nonlabens sp.]
MKQNFSYLIIALCVCMGFSQSGVVVAGFPSSGPGGSSSSSTGQVFQQELSGQGGSASAGNQVVTLSTTTNGMYSGNGQAGFGGPFGNSSMNISDDGTTVSIQITPSGDLSTNSIVIYIDNGSTGRAVIDGTDGNDPGRRAISNANSGDLTFSSGFEATHGIASDNNFGGLFSIPTTGNAISGGSLGFITSVGQTAGSAPFTLTFTWAQIGLTSSDSFDFVATYGNPNDGGVNMFSSNEGYGAGIENGGSNNALGAMTYTSSLKYRGSRSPVSTVSSASLWSSPSSWDTGEVPSSTNEITITNNLFIDTDVTIDNSLTVNVGAIVSVNAPNVFTLNGDLNVNNFALFGFDSDASGSAQFVNGTSAVINGQVAVSRYIPAATNNRKAYRFVTSAVTTSTSIYENWQSGGTPQPGIGTHITGSTTGANGFDQTVSGSGSMLEFIEESGTYQWRFVERTNAPSNLVAGKPYNLFVRGDRNYDLSSSSAPNVDVRLPARGTLNLASSINSGALNPAVGGFDFVGNPYQATLDMTAVTKNNINPNFMYTWDANAATAGAYVTVDISSGSTDPARYIEPGQAFFVVNPSGGAASIDFLASAKAPNATNGGTFLTPNTRPTMTVELWDNGSSGTRYDTAKFNFDGDNVVDAMDAPEIGNWEENLSINKDGILLSIENRAMPAHNEVVLFDFSNVTHTNFELRMNHENLNVNMEAVLVDNFSNTEMTLSTGWNNYAFTVDPNDATSFANDRFALRFEDTTLSNQQIADLEFKIYPNPNSGTVLNISLANAQTASQAVFYTTLGQVSKRIELKGTTNQVNISTLNSGIYLVKVTTGNESVTKKLIIE